jgi:molybdenum cofactor biosynthesis enzyme MoaA
VHDERSLIKEFTYNEAVKLVNEAADLGVISLNITGGEPLLLPYLKHLINYEMVSKYLSFS